MSAWTFNRYFCYLQPPSFIPLTFHSPNKNGNCGFLIVHNCLFFMKDVSPLEPEFNAS